MKRFLIGAIIAIVMTLVVLLCTVYAIAKDSGNAGREAREFVPLSKEWTVLLFPEKPCNSPKLDIALSLLDSTQPENRFILDMLYGGQSAEEYAEKLFHSMAVPYMNMRTEADQFPYGWHWYYKEILAYHAGTAQAAVFSRETDGNAGYLHPMMFKDYFVFSVPDKRRLSLWDIIRLEKKPALVYLVEDALRNDEGINASVDDKLEDFFLSPKGLGFQWDPYEIASFSSGFIEITLPYDRLHGLFTKRGRSLIKDIR